MKKKLFFCMESGAREGQVLSRKWFLYGYMPLSIENEWHQGKKNKKQKRALMEKYACLDIEQCQRALNKG